MKTVVKTILGWILAVTFGILWGLFGALNIAFSGSGRGAQLIQGVLVVIGIYGLIGFVFGTVGHRVGWRWPIAIIAPGAFQLGLFSIAERTTIPLNLVTIIGGFTASALAAHLGAAIERRSAAASHEHGDESHKPAPPPQNLRDRGGARR
jgi:hypothetical protein